jgi:hypothetical protein
VHWRADRESEKAPENDTWLRTAQYAEAARYMEAFSDAIQAVKINPGNYENWNP